MSGAGYFEFVITIRMRAPFLLASADRGRFGVDISQIRDHRNRLVVPDTHLKGVLRHAWEFTGAKGALGRTRLFGFDPDSFENERNDDEPDEDLELAREIGGRLFFTDLVGPVVHQKNRISRVSIDDMTGTADEGHLFSVEQVAMPGEDVEFTGCCTAFVESANEAALLRKHLDLAFSAIPSLGRFKTVGYGRIVHFTVGEPTLVADALGIAHSGTGRRFAIRFTPDKPFLVDVSRPDANTLHGSPVITGSSLKGTLARKFQYAGRSSFNGRLGEVLSRMRIGHAFPLQSGRELAAASLDAIATATKPPSHCRLAPKFDYSDERCIPVFRQDWKDVWRHKWRDEEVVPEDLEIWHQNRTRLAIDPETGASWASRLFSTSCVVPENSDGNVEWLSEIAWPGDASGSDYDLFRECLGQFETGLFTLGKTNARIKAKVTALPTVRLQRSSPFYRIEIATPANLIRPEHLESEAIYIWAFDSYWRGISQDSFCLAWEDVDQGLQSMGEPESIERAIFVKNAYRNDYHSRSHGIPSEPFVVTLPGSVFVVAARDPERAATVLTDLTNSGLPVPNWEEEGPVFENAVSFSDNPFVPENGYGAIRVEEIDP